MFLTEKMALLLRDYPLGAIHSRIIPSGSQYAILTCSRVTLEAALL